MRREKEPMLRAWGGLRVSFASMAHQHRCRGVDVCGLDVNGLTGCKFLREGGVQRAADTVDVSRRLPHGNESIDSAASDG